MARVLIVAYGNPMRSDDGIAWRAADALAPKVSESDVEILRLHQLTPELADAVRNFGTVIFVDAGRCHRAHDGRGVASPKLCVLRQRTRPSVVVIL